MEKRSYRQTRRAEAVEATRQRILSAARDQLVSGEDFTIEAVAVRAGVSRVTVYAQFGGRDPLREAVFDALAQTGGLDAIPTAFDTPDPIESIGRLIDIFCGFYETHRTILRRLNALAALAAGEGEREPDRNQRRRHMLTVLLARVAELPGYEGIDIESTADVLQALTSFEFYDQLAAADARGAEAAPYIRMLAAALLRTG